MTTILTGATGFLGGELLAALLAREPDGHVILAVRTGRGRSAEERVDDLLAGTVDRARLGQARARVHALEVDLAAGRVVLPDPLRRLIAGGRCRIIHGAASVAFDLPLAAARAINVEGTRRMLELAETVAGLARLERFAYVSTAFVAGVRDGVVREDELDVGQRFTNAYERSKLEAEALVWSHADRLPVTVFRPSIVAGHSQTGFTTSFKMLYWPLRAFARGLVVCIPGDRDACFDIVPVDFVAAALLHVLGQGDSIGGCYHLTAGRGLALGRAVELATAFFGVRRVPPFVSPALFWALVYPFLFVTLSGRRRDVLNKGRLYVPYLTRRLVFDNRNTARALAGSALAAPDIEGYLLRLFRYVRESDWGRRPVPEAAAPLASAAGAPESRLEA